MLTTYRVFARALRAAADVLEEAATEAAAERADWMDQASSVLGSRRHIAACRRRMAAGREGAAKVGKRYLLSAEALREELASLGRPAPEPVEETSDYAARMRSALQVVGGDR